MGTSELYSAVEQLSAVADSLVVDVEDGQGGSRLVMFVVPAAGEVLDKPLVDAMSAGIRKALSPRFIPDHFVVAPGIPRTLSGKKQELPVKRLFQGAPLAKIMNLEAMANPEVMPWYVGLAEAWRKDRWDEWLADTAARPGEASAG
jgi:acetoacetyl-CoA synthetase